MGLSLSAESWQVLVAFGCYLVGVVALGVFSHRYLTRGSFVAEYFLGNRGLGPWVLAMTYAATAISGGTFMGFPSLIYSKGWVMALWIASYMVGPLTAMVILGKRINQVARITGSVTVPDVFRDRYQSPALGLTATVLILVFLTFNLVAQFKGGGLVMQEALRLPPREVSLGVMELDQGYLIGLVIFALTVVAYTTYGGFWAVTWTDVLEGLVMLVGVAVMAVLAVQAVPALVVDRPGGGTQELHGLAAAGERLRQIDPRLLSAPGPGDYLPLGVAFSFFFMWSLTAAGQPSGMVRLMSFKDTPSLRRALLLICGYYLLTYLSLLVIFTCARAIFPTQYLGELGSEGNPDSIMPVMARHVAHPLVAGLLLAAPYAAIMSTVAAFLLMISSSLVRDIYQRTINPDVSPRAMKVSSYLATGLVGLIAMLGALNPPRHLQYLIVFTGSGQGCTFLVPMVLLLYWRRGTKEGVLAAMLGGFFILSALYVLGWLHNFGYLPEGWAWLPPRREDKILPMLAGGLEPWVWGLLGSLALGVGVSLLTRPDAEQVKKFFP